jgi:RNA polymerase sigma-70 factor (ECF subfamily)
MRESIFSGRQAVALQKQDQDAETGHLDPTTAVETERCRRELHSYLACCTRSEEEASDLAQEAYLRYLQVPDPGLITRPAGYLFRIAFNLMREWKHRKDRSPVAFNSALADKRAGLWADAGADIYEQLTSREQLQRVLDEIPYKYREVLILNKVEGLSHLQIAERLNLAPNTVLSYMFRALAHARRVQFD